MRFLIKDLSKVHPITKRYLVAATPTWKGDFMAEAARRKRMNLGDYIAVALYSGSHLLGWVMLDFLMSGISPKVRTYIFVKPKYRRRGYGTMLIKKAKEVARRRGRGIRVCPWNRTSRSFFKSVNVSRDEVAPGYDL